MKVIIELTVELDDDSGSMYLTSSEKRRAESLRSMLVQAAAKFAPKAMSTTIHTTKGDERE